MFQLICSHLVKLRGGGVSNLLNYLSLLYNDFTHPRFYIFYIVMWICAMFVLCFVRGGRFRASMQDSAFYGFRGYVLRFVGAILFLGIGLVLSYGAYLVLKKPLFEPRAFNGIGFLVALMCLSFLLLESKKSMFDRIFKYICTGLIVLFTYGLIVFANAYADALSAQSRYTDFRAQKLLDDLMRAVPLDSNMLNVATLESRLDSKSITPVRYKLQGNIGYAPAAMYSISRFGNILRRLLPIHLNGEWYHGAMMFSNLKSSYTYDAYTPGTKVCENLDGKEKILLSQNVYQAIYKVDECVLVELYEGFEYKRW